MIENERGSALFISIVILLSLTLLAIFASNTSIFETEISGNERSYKAALASADGGINYAVELGINGFPTTPLGQWNNWVPPNTINNVTFSYRNLRNTAPRIVQVVATGTAPGGGTTAVSAGIIGVAPGGLSGAPWQPPFTY